MDTSYLDELLGWATLLPLVSFFILLAFGRWLGRASAAIAILAIGGAGVLAFWCLLAIWLPHHWPQAAHHEAGAAVEVHVGDRAGPAAVARAAAGEAERDRPAAHAGDRPAQHEKPAYAGEYYLLGQFGHLRLSIGYYIDALTVCMFCMVTLVATCIHFYSIGYMHEELGEFTDHEVMREDGSPLRRPGRYARFFQYMSLFCFSMLGLVLSGNLAMVFVFWELVGICSYFLIGFYIERKSATNAGNKAFIVNRVGDFGMIVGLMALWSALGTFAFGDSETLLFRTGGTYGSALSGGRLPDGLRQQLAEHGERLSSFLRVTRAGEGRWIVSQLGTNVSFQIRREGSGLAVVRKEAGIFSQVRPGRPVDLGGEPGAAHQLVTPGGMVLAAAAPQVAATIREHEAMFERRAEADQASASEIAAERSQWRRGGLGYGLLLIAGIGIFCGCVGKSAQFPLHVWLPDAMEGPTPVSALVHSATMVAAGVYLVGRFYPFFAPEVLLIIACTGTITLFMAATIAITATDIKRVLAYSTVSQLGYMMMALGVGGWAAGMMHLITHAFFKSLLFLCSGAVIHAVHTNEMPQMGGLLRKMPVTAITMLVGCLAIVGASVPTLVGLSGYYSKDAILEQAFSFLQANRSGWSAAFFVVAAGGAAITAFYMFRLWFLTFVGPPRDPHRYEHAHEAPPVMYVPLIILSVFAIGVAWEPAHGIVGAAICLGISLLCAAALWGRGSERSGRAPVPSNLVFLPLVLSGLVLLICLLWTRVDDVVLANLLEQGRPEGIARAAQHGQFPPAAEAKLIAMSWPNEHYVHSEQFGPMKTFVTLLAFLAGGVGLVLAAAFYWLRLRDADDVRRQFPRVYRFLLNKWWFDELYDFGLVRPAHALSRLAAAIDRRLIDGLVDGLAWTTSRFASLWDAVADRAIVDGLANGFAGWTYRIGLALRGIQGGRIRQYVMFIVLGTILVFVLISFI